MSQHDALLFSTSSILRIIPYHHHHHHRLTAAGRTRQPQPSHQNRKDHTQCHSASSTSRPRSTISSTPSPCKSRLCSSCTTLSRSHHGRQRASPAREPASGFLRKRFPREGILECCVWRPVGGRGQLQSPAVSGSIPGEHPLTTSSGSLSRSWDGKAIWPSRAASSEARGLDVSPPSRDREIPPTRFSRLRDVRPLRPEAAYAPAPSFRRGAQRSRCWVPGQVFLERWPRFRRWKTTFPPSFGATMSWWSRSRAWASSCGARTQAEVGEFWLGLSRGVGSRVPHVCGWNSVRL